jgi:hypothetical protein
MRKQPFNLATANDRLWSAAVTAQIRPVMAALPAFQKIAAFQQATPYRSFGCNLRLPQRCHLFMGSGKLNFGENRRSSSSLE